MNLVVRWFHFTKGFMTVSILQWLFRELKITIANVPARRQHDTRAASQSGVSTGSTTRVGGAVWRTCLKNY